MEFIVGWCRVWDVSYPVIFTLHVSVSIATIHVPQSPSIKPRHVWHGGSA